MTLNVGFFMVGPKVETKYSRRHREWTAWNDSARIVAAGRTKKEAIEHFNAAWWEMWRDLMQAQWTRVERMRPPR